jgi:hypothetical protein
MPGLPVMPKPSDVPVVFISSDEAHDGIPSTSNHHHPHHHQQQQQQQQEQVHMLELKLLPWSDTQTSPRHEDEHYATHLKLSIGGSSSGGEQKNDSPRSCSRERNANASFGVGPINWEVARLKDFASEELKLSMAEKAYAEEARREAKRQIEMAELEFANAKRIRQQAQAELQKAQLLKEQSTKKISSAIMQITCPSCKQHFHTSIAGGGGVGPSDDTTSLGISYMSSATTEGEADQ